MDPKKKHQISIGRSEQSQQSTAMAIYRKCHARFHCNFRSKRIIYYSTKYDGSKETVSTVGNTILSGR